MDSQELVTLSYKKIRKRLVLITILALAVGILLGVLAYLSGTKYTSNTIIIPLTSNSSSSSTSSSIISVLTGSSNLDKSFTEENSVNIAELAQSRTIREEVAATKIPSMGDKTIARLLLDDYKKNKFFFQKDIDPSISDSALNYWAAEYQLKPNLSAIITKTNSFQINYTGKSVDLVKAISYAFIDKISAYYISLKREKAKQDFEFATSKVDSLRTVLHTKDKNLIGMDNKTLFTNTDRMEYRVPVENVIQDKQMIRAQYSEAVSTQQSAAYKLQRSTPVIKVLDKPDPPYETSSRSPIIFGLLGLVGGFLFLSFMFSLPILFKFTKSEVRKLIYGSNPV
ncbi:MAG: hypothetical protein J5I50_09520 [Chitinophagaceae bacterium]|nr:hypothetical protein [Chitinophagaceae bacterium]